MRPNIAFLQIGTEWNVYTGRREPRRGEEPSPRARVGTTQIGNLKLIRSERTRQRGRGKERERVCLCV